MWDNQSASGLAIPRNPISGKVTLMSQKLSFGELPLPQDKPSPEIQPCHLSEPEASVEPDYRIEEYFDTDLLRVRFAIHKSENIRGGEITQRFDTLEEAKKIVLMLRKYKKRIFHLVEARETFTPEQVKKANTVDHVDGVSVGSSSPLPISAPLLPNSLPVTIDAVDFCVMVDVLRAWLGTMSHTTVNYWQRKETLDRMALLLKQVESRHAEKTQ